MHENLDIHALSQMTGISVRTIRYYLAQDLLPSPSGRGPGAIYGPGHLDRLRLIRRLQDAHLPLAEIRKQLQALDDAGVAQALDAPATLAEPPGVSAYDYVRQVLAQAAPPLGVQETPVPGAATAYAPHVAPDQDPAGFPPRKTAPGSGKPRRSTWERIALHADIELHVRRPLARSDQRRLDELLDLAHRLFGSRID